MEDRGADWNEDAPEADGGYVDDYKPPFVPLANLRAHVMEQAPLEKPISFHPIVHLIPWLSSLPHVAGGRAARGSHAPDQPDPIQSVGVIRAL